MTPARTAIDPDAFVPDDRPRCHWATGPWNTPYHDTEWGVPVHDDRTHFEFTFDTLTPDTSDTYLRCGVTYDDCEGPDREVLVGIESEDGRAIGTVTNDRVGDTDIGSRSRRSGVDADGDDLRLAEAVVRPLLEIQSPHY